MHQTFFVVIFSLCYTIQISLGLKYEFGDGSYYIGSVDNQGRPSGFGHFHNSSGDLGENRCFGSIQGVLHSFILC